MTKEKAKEFIAKEISVGTPRNQIKNKLMKNPGWGRTKSYDLILEVAGPEKKPTVGVKAETSNEKEDNAIVERQDAKVEGVGLLDKKTYLYNAATDQYVVFTKKTSSGKYVLGADVVRSLRRDYTESKLTLADIGLKYHFPKDLTVDLLQKLEITHNSIPVTDEDLVAVPSDVLIAKSLERKRAEFQAELEKAQWKDVQADAKKWRQFEYGTIQPFKLLLENWNPPAYVPLRTSILTPKKTDRSFVVGAFDWHVGALVEGKYLINGGDWNIALAKEAIIKYAQDITQRAGNDTVGFEKCIVLCGGDLFQSVSGYTANDTEIPVEVKGDTQFEAIMDLLIYFVSSMKEVFGKVDVHFVRGNHGGDMDIALGHAVRNYFRVDDDIDFNVYSSRHAAFIEKGVLIILDHGASDHTKAKVPTRDADRTKYITDVQHSAAIRPLMPLVKQTLYVMGDKHHYVQKEENTHEFIQVGALPAGDRYAEAKGYFTKSRQNCLILGKNGLESVQHFYFN